MNKLIDKILTEWSYRVHNGMPNPKNPLHLIKLEESLNELRLPRKVSEKLLNNLRGIEEDWWSDLGSQGQARYIKAHPKSKKAQDAKKRAKASRDKYDKKNSRTHHHKTE